MRLIGYGEDALTLWALTERLGILERLNDSTPPEDCLMFYRPSFGRRGGPKGSQFGEFDAIIRSNEAVYLVESKWDGSSEWKGSEVRLRPEQRDRHAIMQLYLELWRETELSRVGEFLATAAPAIADKFAGKPVPPPESRLEENLGYLLKLIGKDFSSIQDVLLLLGREPLQTLPTVVEGQFRTVFLEYEPINPGGMIRLDS